MKRLLILFFMVFVSLFASTSHAYADGPLLVDENQQGQGVNPTTITLEPLDPLPLGDHPAVAVRLLRYDGEPVVNEPVYILVDDKHKNKAITDGNGYAYLTLKYKFPAGQYKIHAVYRGSEKLDLLPAQDETDLIVETSQVSFRTVPPLAGIRLVFNDEIYTTNEDGIINFTVTESGMYTIELLTVSDDDLLPNTRLEFERWNDKVFEPVRELYLPRSRPLEAGYSLNYQVNQIFLDPHGKQIDPSRVSLMSVRGVGKYFTFEEGGPHWLPANRLVRRIGERLESLSIPYYFQNVTIDGANVVNRSEQRFFIHPNDVLPVRVLVYSANFSSRDAMFGFSIGSGVNLEFPDGHIEYIPFESDGTITVDALARGSYTATVSGAGGSSPPIPIHLSQDQDIELVVISYLDMAVIFGVPFVVAVSFLFIGRPYLLPYVFRPFRFLRRIPGLMAKGPE